MNSLTLVNLHFSDQGNEGTTLKLIRDGGFGRIEFSCPTHTGAQKEDLSSEGEFLKHLMQLWILPLQVQRPPRGASIHYAGTLPVSTEELPNRTKTSGELWDFPGIFVADSSSWKFLPAKGLTLTLMANARRVAREVSLSLRY